MNQVTVKLPDDVLARLRDESERMNQSLDEMIQAAILYFLEEPTEAEILASLRTGMQQALTGDYRPAHEVLDEIDQETTQE